MEITAEYIDRRRIRIQSSPDILYEIQNAFSYYAKDYKHMPLYKRGIWDGRIRIFKVTERILPVGLFPAFQRIAETKGWRVEIRNSRFAEPLPFDVDRFLSDVATTTNLEIMDHQLQPVEDVLSSSQRLILSPTSSGKSLIIYLVARYINKVLGRRTLIIVPNKTLVAQLYDDLLDYANDGWDSVHKIYAGQEVETSHDVVVSTYQSAVKLPSSFYEKFGAIMIDEAHGATAKSITGILEHTGHMIHVAGFTGTLDGTHMHELEMRARFGDVTKVVTTKELMDRGIVADLSIDALTMRYSESECKLAAKMSYKDEVDFITTHVKRNNFIAELAASATDKNVMVLFNLTAHGHELKRRIEERLGAHQELFYVDGSVSIEDRQPIRAYMEANKGCVLLASYGTSSVGLSIKNIHWMILAHPYKNRIRVLQTIGRGLRISETKKHVTVTDIGDYLAGNRKTPNTTYEHFLARLELYSKEGFDYNPIEL